MKMLNHMRLLTLAVASTALLTGCGGDMSDLEQWVADKKAERVPFLNDLPEVKPYKVFVYSAENERSPFVASEDRSVPGSGSGDTGPVPDRNRNPEHLENFPLDSLRMVGSLNTGNVGSALVQTNDGLIHRVRPGNYMGQNYGRVTSIDDSNIELVELVPNGLGGWAEREAAIGLSD